MTQEEKQLLLKDLCTRLPYEVKILDIPANVVGDLFLVSTTDTVEYEPVDETNNDTVYQTLYNIKPYLRPMSSMTEEEKKKLKEETCPNGTGLFDKHYLICPVNHYGEQISFEFMSDIINWLNAHHFDYRGLIEKGLALEAPEGMYKTE